MMKVSITTLSLADLDVDLLLALADETAAAKHTAALAKTLGDAVQRGAHDFTGDAEDAIVLYPDKGKMKRVALLGLGERVEVDAERLREAGAAGAKLADTYKADTVAITLPDTALSTEVASQAFVEGFLLASYRFTRYKTKNETFAGPSRLVVHVADNNTAARRGADRGRVVAEATMSARDLVNLSPHDKTPTLLAQAIEKAAKRHGYTALVWDKALIEEEKMGGLLAVNRGSVEPPTFTVLEWQPENPVNERPVVLVGKGVVFDTGGLSLKPTKGSMDHMKADMAGAAAVIGTFEAIARLNLPLYVVGLIPATDNRPGENAYVPGDVVTMHSGKTVEVLNTDAEGRMLLADALSYAKIYKPDLVIDVATLTGAAVVALGSDTAAVLTREDKQAAERLDAIEAAGQRSGDRVHRLPMFDVYAALLDSDVADIKNVGGREAGTITAAKFLEHFVDYPWMHVDIAGPAFLEKPKPYRPVGGTGFGVRLLVEFLREYASPKKQR